MAKKKNQEEVKVEVENIRLSKDYKERLVHKYVREKFAQKIAAIEALVSKEVAKAHANLFPELSTLPAEFQIKWIQQYGSKFRIKFPRILVGWKEFRSQDSFPMPKTYDYQGLAIQDPTEELTALLNQLTDVENEQSKFKSNFENVLNAVSTSKQLCDLIPELAPLFPKRAGITGSPCTQLVPIDLIRSVRKSFRVNTDEVQEVR